MTESTAFLQSRVRVVPIKTVDLDYSSTMFSQPLILDQLYWYFEESYLHDKFEYVPGRPRFRGAKRLKSESYVYECPTGFAR